MLKKTLSSQSMAEPDETVQKMLEKVLEKAANDPVYFERLAKDPKNVLIESGIPIAPSLKLQTVAHFSQIKDLPEGVVPFYLARMDEASLEEIELMKVLSHDIHEITDMDKSNFLKIFNKILKKADGDEQYFENLRKDPIQILKQEGIPVKPNVTVKAITHLSEVDALPPEVITIWVAKTKELSLEELELVSGGSFLQGALTIGGIVAGGAAGIVVGGAMGAVGGAVVGAPVGLPVPGAAGGAVFGAWVGFSVGATAGGVAGGSLASHIEGR